MCFVLINSVLFNRLCVWVQKVGLRVYLYLPYHVFEVEAVGATQAAVQQSKLFFQAGLQERVHEHVRP